MNIIFLDIDGVITNARTGYMAFDIYAVEFINWICKEANCKIVITSTWRYNHNKEFFEKYFFDNLHGDWEIPDLGDFIARGIEIDEWLKKHTEIDNYLILDDDVDMSLMQIIDHFIKTDTYDGLLIKHYAKIKDFFGIKKIPDLASFPYYEQKPTLI